MSSLLPDPFDALMVSRTAILQKATFTPGGGDAYGQPDQSFTTVIASWPCRMSTLKAGAEYVIGKEAAKNVFLVFMRPPLKDDNNVSFTLNTHHWLRVTDERGQTHLLNITVVNDPSTIGHHLEVKGEEYLP